MSNQAYSAEPQGIILAPLTRTMLHEQLDHSSLESGPVQRSIFQDLESQMADHDKDFKQSIELIHKAFMFRNPQPVTEFLTTHRSLVPILLEAKPFMANAFGADTPLALEIMSDDGPPNSIYALALWGGDRASARTCLSSFDENWAVKNIPRTGARIVFDYELI